MTVFQKRDLSRSALESVASSRSNEEVERSRRGKVDGGPRRRGDRAVVDRRGRANIVEDADRERVGEEGGEGGAKKATVVRARGFLLSRLPRHLFSESDTLNRSAAHHRRSSQTLTAQPSFACTRRYAFMLNGYN